MIYAVLYKKMNFKSPVFAFGVFVNGNKKGWV